ncbi:radish, isoform I [Phthorimaea operculella]|nr:radish, isoform I [Phthorimaea operculella]
MTAICFVCNLPILSHQVGLVWAGGNGWDELTRSMLEENTLRQRLGSRRDSAAQVSCLSPPEPDVNELKGAPRRRRSSLAQLTDILREWGGGSSAPRRQRPQLSRRETLADLARSLPWARHDTAPRRRRDSSADSGIKSMSKRRESKCPQDFRSEFPTLERRESTSAMTSKERRAKRRASREDTKDRRDSMDGHRGEHRHHRRDSMAPRVVGTHRKRRASPPQPAAPSFVDASSDPGPSTHMPSVTIVAIHEPSRSDGECQSTLLPTIITSAVTPSPTSPTVPKTMNSSGGTQTVQTCQTGTQSTQAIQVTPSKSPPSLGGRRDSTTQCGRIRRDSRAGVSPERRLGRLQRQATAYDEPIGPPGRRSSGPSLGPDDEGRARRDSLSPDSAARPRRERSQLSPDRAGGVELSPAAARRRSRLRRQASCARVGRSRSPESSSCSSRDPSPGARPPPERQMIRRQSTTEEILIARGFRRQSTTEEMIRCRNFRRQSSQSDDACMRARGRRDSATQILDGTIGTMTVETTSTFFDSSTQTEPSPLYDNNHYHEECLRCNSCGLNLTGPNQKRARRFKNQILCDLHFADVALMECSDFMQQLRSFKPQSLGCAVARRKSSTTLIFPLPPQACSGKNWFEPDPCISDAASNHSFKKHAFHHAHLPAAPAGLFRLELVWTRFSQQLRSLQL